MSSGTHYVIDRTGDRTFTIRPEGDSRPLAAFPTLPQALDYVKTLNPDDYPSIVPSLVSRKAA